MQPDTDPVDSRADTEVVPSFSRWGHWPRLLLCLIVGFVLRWNCVNCKSFWFDECYSVEVSRLDWRNFFHVLWWREANMSLYYALLKVWLYLGQSPSFIRGLSILVGVASILAIFWLANLLYGRRVGLIAAALFTFNAYSVRYSQEARSYSLFLLLTTLASGFFVAYLHRATKFHRIGYILTSLLACYAHFYALLLIAAQWLAVRWNIPPGLGDTYVREIRRSWIRIGIGVFPLIIFIAKTGAGPIKWIQRPGMGDLFNFFEHLAGSDHWILLLNYVLASAAAIIPVAGRLFVSNKDWSGWREQFLLIWILFPVVLTVLLSFARPVFLARYMIFILPAFVILAAAGLARLRKDWLLALVLVPVLLLASQGISYVYAHDFDTERDESGMATNFILDHARAGDGVIFHIANTRAAYEFFRSLRAGENTASPYYEGHLGPEIVFPNHGPGMDYRDFTGKPTPDFVRASSAAHPRIWLMLMNNGTAGKTDPTTDMLKNDLKRAFQTEKVWQFARVELRLYSNEP